MNNQQGSAVVIVLLFLGVVSMIGAGLILQSQMDVQFTSALQGSDMTMNMADAGSVTALRNMPEEVPMAKGYDNPIVVTAIAVPVLQYSASFTYRTVFMGPAPQMAGAGQGELGLGGYEGGSKPYYWTCEGMAKPSNKGSAGASADDTSSAALTSGNESRVQIATIKLHPDN